MSKCKGKQLIRSLLLVLILCMAFGCSTYAAVRKPQIKMVKGTLKRHTITWQPVAGADGYFVYGWNDVTAYEDMCLIGILNNPKAKKFVTVPDRITNAVYEYQIGAFQIINGKRIVVSMSDPKFYFNDGKTYRPWNTSTKSMAKNANILMVNPTQDEKFFRVFGRIPKKEYVRRYPGAFYSTDAQAVKNMTTITVRVWDFAYGSSGKKITRTFSLTVHKKLAPTVQKIFDTIYRNPSHFPIHTLGGYRPPEGHSEHTSGTAIDINYNENYMINSSGQIVSGSFWKPGVNPYSIPKDGIVAMVFAKYGFAQGDWSSAKDYMHFSYFHT